MAQPDTYALFAAGDAAGPTKIGPVCERRTLVSFVGNPSAGAAPGQIVIAFSARALRRLGGLNPGIAGGGSFFAFPANGSSFGPYPVDKGQQLYAVGTSKGLLVSAWTYSEYAEEERGEVVQPPMIGTPPAFPQAGTESPGAHPAPRVTAVPTTPKASPNGVAPHHTGVVRPRASGIQ